MAERTLTQAPSTSSRSGTERYRPLVFSTRNPPSAPTFLVDGQVAGAWRYERGRVRIAPFAKVEQASRRELRQEADRLADFHA